MRLQSRNDGCLGSVLIHPRDPTFESDLISMIEVMMMMCRLCSFWTPKVAHAIAMLTICFPNDLWFGFVGISTALNHII